jgi:hypothetical protein
VTLVETVVLDLAELQLPSGWKSRLKPENVNAIAEGLRAGQVTPPIAVDGGRNVLWGFHRIAAHIKAGINELRADVLVFDDEREQEAAVISENLRRLHLPAAEISALTKRLVDLAENSANDADRDFGDTVPEPIGPTAHRPKTSRGEARAKVAKDLGEKPETIKKRDQRAQKAQQPKDEPASPVDLHGLSLPAGHLSIIDTVAQALRDIDAATQTILARITRLANELAGTGEDKRLNLQELRWHVAEAGKHVRARVPADLCPYCKGVTRELRNCAACQGSGYVTRDQLGDVPEELRGWDEPAIYVAGKLRKVRELAK